MRFQAQVFRAAVTAAALFTASVALAQPAASPLSAYSYADCSATNAPQVRIVLYTGASSSRLACQRTDARGASHLQRHRGQARHDADYDYRRCDERRTERRRPVVSGGGGLRRRRREPSPCSGAPTGR